MNETARTALANALTTVTREQTRAEKDLVEVERQKADLLQTIGKLAADADDLRQALGTADRSAL